mmetsp:Transcript_3391/g.13816  ORF Transcript_3391/g.13816 Transcript_3391/m.13816 type:complete len:297 (+) Transcript_3391:332-1222(+)
MRRTTRSSCVDSGATQKQRDAWGELLEGEGSVSTKARGCVRCTGTRKRSGGRLGATRRQQISYGRRAPSSRRSPGAIAAIKEEQTSYQPSKFPYVFAFFRAGSPAAAPAVSESPPAVARLTYFPTPVDFLIAPSSPASFAICPAGSDHHLPGLSASVRSRASFSSLAFFSAASLSSASAMSLYGSVNTFVLLMTMGSFGLSSSAVGTRSISASTSTPPTSRPNTVCFPSRWRALLYVMKNWDPLVCGPLLAMESTPRPSCTRWVISSLNLSPQMHCPPDPVPVGSPPWIMKFLMLR